MKPFLITGCGRSGTTYMARLLNNLGIRTAHEEYWSASVGMRESVRFTGWLASTATSGEVSGLAVPALAHEDNTVGSILKEQGVVVFHQVRNPVAVIASLMGLRNFHPENRWLTNIKFNHRWLPILDQESEPLRRCMFYWTYWNEMLLGYDYPVCQIEDTHNSVKQILAGIEEVREDSQIDEAMTAIDERAWNGGARDTSVSWRTLPAGPLKEQFLRVAHACGYTNQDLESYCPLGSHCPHCGETPA